MKPLRGGEGILVDYMVRARAPSAEYQDPERYRQAELAQAGRVYQAHKRSVERVRQQHASPQPKAHDADRAAECPLYLAFCTTVLKSIDP